MSHLTGMEVVATSTSKLRTEKGDSSGPGYGANTSNRELRKRTCEQNPLIDMVKPYKPGHLMYAEAVSKVRHDFSLAESGLTA